MAVLFIFFKTLALIRWQNYGKVERIKRHLINSSFVYSASFSALMCISWYYCVQVYIKEDFVCLSGCSAFTLRRVWLICISKIICSVLISSTTLSRPPLYDGLRWCKLYCDLNCRQNTTFTFSIKHFKNDSNNITKFRCSVRISTLRLHYKD